MPLLLISLLILMTLGILILHFVRKPGSRLHIDLSNRGLDWVIFIICLVSFIISLALFWNISVYADESGASIGLVYGGSFWLYMAWSQLGLLFVLCVISGSKLVGDKD